jgi:hypothetical protein
MRRKDRHRPAPYMGATFTPMTPAELRDMRYGDVLTLLDICRTCMGHSDCLATNRCET